MCYSTLVPILFCSFGLLRRQTLIRMLTFIPHRAMIDFTNFADLPVWEGAPKRGGFQLVLGLELVTFIAPSLADQTCANGINKRGPSACTSMKCVERTVIAALRRLSKSGSPSLLGALSQIRPFNLPAYPLEWASSIEQITSLVTSEDLFTFWWDAVSPRWFNGLIDAIILAIFTAEVVHLTDFQASLRTMKITTSDYTCPIPTETFKSCPSMTLTTLYPTLGTSLDVSWKLFSIASLY